MTEEDDRARAYRDQARRRTAFQAGLARARRGSPSARLGLLGRTRALLPLDRFGVPRLDAQPATPKEDPDDE